MRVLITGDRAWPTRPQAIRVILDAIRTLPWDAVIIHGAAAGADSIAAAIALARGLSVDYPEEPGLPLGGYAADWESFGPAAGPRRNTRMLNDGVPDQVWAFHDKLWTQSKGTRNCVEQALDLGIPVTVFKSNGEKGAVQPDHESRRKSIDRRTSVQ